MPDDGLSKKEAAAAMWHAVEKVAGKEKRRAELTDGAAYDVALSIDGKINGQAIDRHKIAGKLTVGHEQTVNSSSGPDAAHVLALVLCRLNGPTREKLLRSLPKRFADGGGVLPDAPADVLDAAGQLLKQLRATKPVTKKGPVSATCSVEVE